MHKLKVLINDRPVAILAHGKSIKELENYIEKFQKYDICWASLGVFNMMEDFILSKINKKLDIVYDSATVSGGLLEYYETKVRLPRIREFVTRNVNNVWITTEGVIKDSVYKYDPALYLHNKDKITIVDRLFFARRPADYMDVPNSLTLLIASMLAGNCSKIILFGFDGYKGEVPCPPDSCYHPELIEAERKVAIGNINDAGINRDTMGFEKRFPAILRRYRLLFGNKAQLYNCSPITVYNCIQKINYNELESIL